MASSGGGDAGGGAKCKRKQAFLAMADDDGGNDRNNNSSNNHPNNENDDVEEVDDLVADLRAEMKGAGTAASAIRERSTSFSAEDYESVSSPGGSSTASGPTYIRPAGFDHHAQEILAPKQQQQHQQQSSSSQQQPMGCVGSSLVSPPPPSVRSVLSRHSFSGPTGTGALAPSSGPGSRSTAKKKKTLLSADFADKRLEGVVRPKTRKGEKQSCCFRALSSCRIGRLRHSRNSFLAPAKGEFFDRLSLWRVLPSLSPLALWQRPKFW